jgi:hypothetical protein
MNPASIRPAAVAGTVVVHVPAEVTFDLGKFNKVIANLGERLGCGPCISGANCNFSIISEYLVDPATLKVNVHTAGPQLGGAQFGGG